MFCFIPGRKGLLGRQRLKAMARPREKSIGELEDDSMGIATGIKLRPMRQNRRTMSDLQVCMSRLKVVVISPKIAKAVFYILSLSASLLEGRGIAIRGKERYGAIFAKIVFYAKHLSSAKIFERFGPANHRFLVVQIIFMQA